MCNFGYVVGVSFPRKFRLNFWETTRSKTLSLSNQSLMFEVSPWRVGVEVNRELKFLRDRQTDKLRGVTESKQRPGTKVYWIIQKQSGKRKMSSLAPKCWTLLLILPIHPQGLERGSLDISHCCAVKGHPKDDFGEKTTY